MESNNIGFWTPVKIQDPQGPGDDAFNATESYFNLGGERLPITYLKKDEICQTELRGKTPFLSKLFKVISYATIIFPLIMLAAKLILRAVYADQFGGIDKKIKAIKDSIENDRLQEAFEQAIELPDQVAAKNKLLSEIAEKDLEKQGANELTKEVALYLENRWRAIPVGWVADLIDINRLPVYHTGGNPGLKFYALLAEKQIENNQPDAALDTLGLVGSRNPRLPGAPEKKQRLLKQIAEANPAMAKDILEHLRRCCYDVTTDLKVALSLIAAEDFVTRQQNPDEAFKVLRENFNDRMLSSTVAQYEKVNELLITIANIHLQRGSLDGAQEVCVSIGKRTWRNFNSSIASQADINRYSILQEDLAKTKNALLSELALKHIENKDLALAKDTRELIEDEEIKTDIGLALFRGYIEKNDLMRAKNLLLNQRDGLSNQLEEPQASELTGQLDNAFYTQFREEAAKDSPNLGRAFALLKEHSNPEKEEIVDAFDFLWRLAMNKSNFTLAKAIIRSVHYKIEEEARENFMGQVLATQAARSSLEEAS